MNYKELFREENSNVSERYDLMIERIRAYVKDGTQNAVGVFNDYFEKTAAFILMLDEWKQFVYRGDIDKQELSVIADWNKRLYSDILADTGAYETSYANPAYACEKLGEDYGRMLSFLYAEIRGGIIYAVEYRYTELTILLELFVEVLCLFEEEVPPVKELNAVLYYFVSDYAEMMIDYRVREMVDPALSFATDIIMESDLTDIRYLYKFGEYISDNEIKMAEFLGGMSQEKIDSMAYTYTHGYEEGFRIAGIDLSKKKTVNIRYFIGQVRMVKAAIKQFEKMGLEPVIYRAPTARVNKRLTARTGYAAISANKQYDYDHRMDEALYLDKAFVERKIAFTRNAYESRKQLAKEYAGPAVIEVFGEKPFEPVNKKESMRLTDKQQKLSV